MGPSPDVRIAFFGTPDPALPSLRALLDDEEIEVVLVVTNPDRPAGRGYRLTPPPVKVVAEEAGVRVWQPERPAAVAEDLAAEALDACAVVAYGAILPPQVLAAGGAGFVNLHFSLLPAWRGAAPVAHTLLRGDAVTGVTCFVLDEGMDTGPVLASRETPVPEGATAGELTAALAELGAPVLVEAVRGLVDGSLQPMPQQHEAATLAPKIDAAQAALDWTEDAATLERTVRALNPVPGAHTELDGLRVKVHRAAVVDGTGPPGSVIAVDDGPVVACGAQALRLAEVQPAGKAPMSGAAFANGYQPLGRRFGG